MDKTAKKSRKDKLMDVMVKEFVKKYPYLTDERTVNVLVGLGDYRTVELLLPHYLEKEKVDEETVEYHLAAAKRLKEMYGNDTHLRLVAGLFAKDAKKVLEDFFSHSTYTSNDEMNCFYYIVQGYSVLGNYKSDIPLEVRSELRALFDTCLDKMETPRNVLNCENVKGVSFKIVEGEYPHGPMSVLDPVPNRSYRVVARIPKRRIKGGVVAQFGIRHVSLNKNKKRVEMMDGKTFSRRNFYGYSVYYPKRNESAVKIRNFCIEAPYERPFLRKIFFCGDEPEEEDE